MPDREIQARFIEPMLLPRTENLPQGALWQYELKLDGFRAQAIKSGRVRFRLRRPRRGRRSCACARREAAGDEQLRRRAPVVRPEVDDAAAPARRRGIPTRPRDAPRSRRHSRPQRWTARIVREGATATSPRVPGHSLATRSCPRMCRLLRY